MEPRARFVSSSFGNERRLGRRRDSAKFRHPFMKCSQGNFTLPLMAFFAVTDACLERREQVEGNVGGLKTFGVSLGHIVQE